MDNKKSKYLLELAQKGGNDAHLVLLDKMFEDYDELEREIGMMKEKITELENHKPMMEEMMSTLKDLASKETPAPVVNVSAPEVNVETKAPIINVQPNVEIPQAVVNVPAPIVNVKAEVVGKELDIELRETVEKLSQTVSELQGKIEEKKDVTVYGPGKTKIVKVDLSSQLNGVTKTFFIGTHFGIVSVDSSSAPFGAFREGVDYNESGKNIVFTSSVDETISLAAGQSLIVKILK